MINWSRTDGFHFDSQHISFCFFYICMYTFLFSLTLCLVYLPRRHFTLDLFLGDSNGLFFYTLKEARHAYGSSNLGGIIGSVTWFGN